MPARIIECKCDFPDCEWFERLREPDYANRGWSFMGTYRLCPKHADATRREFVDAINYEFQLAAAN